MKIIKGGLVMGVLLGCVGLAGMLGAFPVYRWNFCKMKEKLSPRILELASELSNEESAFFE